MRRALSVLVSLSWLLNGCTTWKTEEVAPASYIETRHPGKVRLTLQNSTQLTLQSPAVVGDSIVGTADNDSTSQAVAQSNVRSLEVRRVNATKSIFLGLGVAAAAALAAFFVAVAIAVGASN